MIGNGGRVLLVLLVIYWSNLAHAGSSGSLHYSQISSSGKAFTQQSWFVDQQTIQYARYCPAGQLLVLRQMPNQLKLTLDLPPERMQHEVTHVKSRPSRFWIWFPTATMDPVLLDGSIYALTEFWQQNGRLKLELGKAPGSPAGSYIQFLPYKGKDTADLRLSGKERWLKSLQRQSGLFQPITLTQLRHAYPELYFGAGVPQLWDIAGERWLIRLFDYPATQSPCQESGG